MKEPRVLVAPQTTESREKYWDILSEVFSDVPSGRLHEGMDNLGPDTRFFAVEAPEGYASVLFVTPISIEGRLFGGIGGVCTRSQYRGLGYGRIVLERTLALTSSDYDVLLLWTRIPEYFARFGFLEMPDVFVLDAGGSSPMFYFHDEGARSAVADLRDLPPLYF